MRSWLAVRTHARAEEKAFSNLCRQGYEVCLPRHVKRRRHARYTDFVRAPLFPRYLFVSLDKLNEQWRPILSTIGVCDLVRQGDYPATVLDGLIEELRVRERQGVFDHGAQIRKIKPGDPVRITAGPFADIVGRFCGMATEERVYVLLNLLGRVVRAQLPNRAVDPA